MKSYYETKSLHQVQNFVSRTLFAVQQARKNVLGISPSAFCQILKEDLRWYPRKMIRRHKRWWLGETFTFLLVVSASVQQVKILSKVCSWCWTWICFEFAAQQTSTVKLPALFLRFQTEERVRRVNESKITGQNTFNGDHFKIERNPESSKGKKTFFGGIFTDLWPLL